MITSEKIKQIYLRNKEVIHYLIFGGLTTIVNFICYFIFAKVIHVDEIISSALSWFASVLFAYVTNKIFVFHSRLKRKRDILKEMISFFGCRILSGVFCDVGTFALMVKILHINDVIAKIITQVMVVIVNYLLSKLFIFKKGKD